MSMRSANNPRTQNREYAGATRKGASSAKAGPRGRELRSRGPRVG